MSREATWNLALNNFPLRSEDMCDMFNNHTYNFEKLQYKLRTYHLTGPTFHTVVVFCCKLEVNLVEVPI